MYRNANSLLYPTELTLMHYNTLLVGLELAIMAPLWSTDSV